MKRWILAAFLGLSLAGPARSEQLGSPWIEALYRASQAAPTVIVGHGCDGTGPHHDAWARQIQQWGYNAVVLDSFGPRGFYHGICNVGKKVPPYVRVGDVRAVVEKIRASDFHRGRIGYVGFSHGGALALQLANAVDPPGVDAIVAFYPWCSGYALLHKDASGQEKPLDFTRPGVPTLMLLGGRDNWTPIEHCLKFSASPGYSVHIYENASHAFDVNRPYRNFAGHVLWYDAEADRDSRAKTQAFFREHLD